MTIEEKLSTHAVAVNNFLHSFFEGERESQQTAKNLKAAMRYGTLNGGKRFRPFLVFETASLFDVPSSQAVYAAAAVECIHCYSLIHDDLPAMDDDALRRGQPTVHIKFDEATAILAGDALQSMAFEILAHPNAHQDGAVRSSLVASLARASGWLGMAGGQDLDLQAAAQEQNLEQIQLMQRMKTGALIEWSCEAGALLGGAGEGQIEALKHYARALGLGFQIADDLLDHEGDVTEVGKDVGKDVDAGKATFVAALGVKGAKKKLAALEAEAIESLSQFSTRADDLVAAAKFVTQRRR